MSNNIWGGIDYNNTKRIINLKSQVDSMQMEQQNLIEMMPTKADVTYVDGKHTEMQDLLAESELATDARLDDVDILIAAKEDTTSVDTKLALKVDKAGGNFTTSLKINPTVTAADKIIFSNGSGGTYSGHKIVQTANSLDEYIPNGSRNQWYYTSADGLTRTLAFSISGDTGNIAFTNALNLPTVTANRVLVTDGLKYIVHSGVTATELTSLSGITGNVQTRLGAIEAAAYVQRRVHVSFVNGAANINNPVGYASTGTMGSGNLFFTINATGTAPSAFANAIVNTWTSAYTNVTGYNAEVRNWGDRIDVAVIEMYTGQPVNLLTEFTGAKGISIRINMIE